VNLKVDHIKNILRDQLISLVNHLFDGPKVDTFEESLRAKAVFFPH